MYVYVIQVGEKSYPSYINTIKLDARSLYNPSKDRPSLSGLYTSKVQHQQAAAKVLLTIPKRYNRQNARQTYFTL